MDVPGPFLLRQPSPWHTWLALARKDIHLPAWGVALGYLLTGGCSGLTAWNLDTPVSSLVAVLVLPLVWGVAKSRLAAAALMLGYYLGASCGAISGIPVFFGVPSALWMGFGAWIGFAAAVTLPFALLWSPDLRMRPWRFLIALTVLSLPPLGAIGMVSPLFVSGALFPWLGWVGLALTLLLMLSLGYRRVRWTLVLVSLALVANGLAQLQTPTAPAGWHGVDTHFEGLATASTGDAGQVLASMRRIDWLTEYAKTIPKNSVVVLPETILGSVNGLASIMLDNAETSLRARGSLVLAGAELPQANGNYYNAILVLGMPAGARLSTKQNIPVPFAMWKPWARDGAIANIWWPRSTVRVKGVDVSVVVCYEQFLSYALFAAMLDDPKVLVAASNIWWAQGTTIGAIQQQSVAAVARLFGVATIRAQNV